MTQFAHIGNADLIKVELTIPNKGCWVARVVFDEDANVEGQITLSVGDTNLVGFIDPGRSGSAFSQRSATVIGGRGGWSRILPPKAYHSDPGVSARVIADDAARASGEILGTLFVPQRQTVGIDFVRLSQEAAKTLEQAIGSATWWIDPDGTTQVGSRPPKPLDAKLYNILAYDPVARSADISVDELSVFPGSVLSDRLDVPMAVQEVVYSIDSGGIKCKASSAPTTTQGSLVDALRSVVRQYTAPQLSALFRYRVVKMAGDRVNLQSVSKLAGVPEELHPISIMTMAGSQQTLTEGSIVLVAFLENDPTLPMIVGCTSAESLVLCGSNLAAARETDPVEVDAPLFCKFAGASPMTAGTPYGLSFSTDAAGLIPVTKFTGTITAGSPKVKL